MKFLPFLILALLALSLSVSADHDPGGQIVITSVETQSFWQRLFSISTPLQAVVPPGNIEVGESNNAFLEFFAQSGVSSTPSKVRIAIFEDADCTGLGTLGLGDCDSPLTISTVSLTTIQIGALLQPPTAASGAVIVSFTLIAPSVPGTYQVCGVVTDSIGVTIFQIPEDCARFEVVSADTFIPFCPDTGSASSQCQCNFSDCTFETIAISGGTATVTTCFEYVFVSSTSCPKVIDPTLPINLNCDSGFVSDGNDCIPVVLGGIGATCGIQSDGGPLCEAGLSCANFQCVSPSVCGDNICQSDETTASCLADCPDTTSTGSTTTGGGGGTGGTTTGGDGGAGGTDDLCALKSPLGGCLLCAPNTERIDGVCTAKPSGGADDAPIDEDQGVLVPGRVPSIEVEDLDDASQQELADSYCFLDVSCSGENCVSLNKLDNSFSNVEDFRDDLSNIGDVSFGGLGLNILKGLLFFEIRDIPLFGGGSFSLNEAAFEDADINLIEEQFINLKDGGICVDGDVPTNFFEKFALDIGISTNILLIAIAAIFAVVFLLPKGGRR